MKENKRRYRWAGKIDDRWQTNQQEKRLALESNRIVSTEKNSRERIKIAKKRGGMKDPKISPDREGRMTIVGGCHGTKYYKD